MTDERPALSQSIAHILVSESPLHAWSAHRLLGGEPRPTTDAQSKGRLLHRMLLEGGDGIVVLDYPDWRTKAAREERAEVTATGKLPILAEAYAELVHSVERIRANIDTAGVSLEGGECEVRLEWHEESRVGGVLCHGVLDWLSDDHSHIIDLKTGEASAHPDACAARLVRYGGALQDAAYRSAVSKLWPEMIGRVAVTFVFVETVAPFAVTPVTCASTMREYGESRWLRAVELWARCLESNHWPGYGATRVEAPPWALAREMEMEEEAWR